jgi:Fe-S-cluster containining protein
MPFSFSLSFLLNVFDVLVILNFLKMLGFPIGFLGKQGLFWVFRFSVLGKLMHVKGKYEFDYSEGIRFRCERCALCCGDTADRVRRILLLRVEAERVSQVAGKSVDAFAEGVVGFEPYVFQMKKADGKCVFLEGNLCSIYEVRPLICVFYPFELKEAGTNRFVFAFTKECPAIGKGRVLEKSYFERLFAEFVRVMEKK